MNFAKYLFAFLFALSLTVVMVGCGDADADADTDDTSEDGVEGSEEEDVALDDESLKQADEDE